MLMVPVVLGLQAYPCALEGQTAFNDMSNQ